MKQGDRWIIFYTDGSTFSCVDGSPWDAPRRSVQSITSIRDGGNDWYNINMAESFYYEESTSNGLAVGGWHKIDNEATFYDHLIRAKYPCIVFGRMLSDGAWKHVHHKIVEYCRRNHNFLVGLTDERPEKKYL